MHVYNKETKNKKKKTTQCRTSIEKEVRSDSLGSLNTECNKKKENHAFEASTKELKKKKKELYHR